MKKSIGVGFVVLLLGTLGCATTKSDLPAGFNRGSEIPDGAVTDHMNYFQNLADYLYRIPGITVSGPSSNPTVTIRGISSFNAGIEPLYVVDGNPVGTSYTQVNNMLNIKDIAHVQVLKGSQAAMYGVRGGNGVILITTRR